MSDAPIDERYEIAAEMLAAQAEIESLRWRLAEAEALLWEARDDYGLGMNLGGRIDAFLGREQP